MNTLDLETLDHVNGGVVASRASSTTSITDSLTALQTQLQTLTTNANNNQNPQNNLLLPMVMMMAFNRRQPTVISPGATVIG
jgi:hypothetical protein